MSEQQRADAYAAMYARCVERVTGHTRALLTDAYHGRTDGHDWHAEEIALNTRRATRILHLEQSRRATRR